MRSFFTRKSAVCLVKQAFLDNKSCTGANGFRIGDDKDRCTGTLTPHFSYTFRVSDTEAYPRDLHNKYPFRTWKDITISPEEVSNAALGSFCQPKTPDCIGGSEKL